MAETIIYGRPVDLTKTWFLAQGYCDVTADHGMAQAESGAYTPETNIAWLTEHIKTCGQCLDANDVKDSIIRFIKARHSDLLDPYMRGEKMPNSVILEWMGNLMLSPRDRAAFGRLAPHLSKVASVFSAKYGNGGDGLPKEGSDGR